MCIKNVKDRYCAVCNKTIVYCDVHVVNDGKGTVCECPCCGGLIIEGTVTLSDLRRIDKEKGAK